MHLVHFLFVILCLIVQTASANTSLCIEGSDRGFNVTPYLSSYVTRNQNLTITDIQRLEQHRQFSKVEQSTFNAGYSSDTYVLRFQLDKQCIQRIAKDSRNLSWWLEIPFSHLDYVTLYSPVNKTTSTKELHYQAILQGDRLPFSERLIENSGIIFPLHLSDYKDLVEDPVFFLKIQSQDSIQVPLFLRTPEAHSSHSPTITLLQGIYFGILLVIIFYNLFIYFSVKDKTYLYYIAYISSFFIVQLSMLGAAQRYLWPESPEWANRAIPFFFMITFAAGTQFVRSLLHTKEHLPVLDRTLFKVVCLFLCILPLTTFVHYRTIIYLAVLGAFIFFLLLLYTGVMSVTKKVRSAYFFLVAWITFLITGTVYAMMIIDLLPINAFTLYAYQVGSAIEVILLSLALADRINTIQAEKTKLEEENTQVLEQANEQLELSHQLKDSFMTTVSHEIRTPLNGLVGITELLKDTPLNTQQQNYVELLTNSGNTLSNLINDVLDFSKIEAGQLNLEAISFSCLELSDEVITVFGGTALNKGLKLSCFVSPNVPQKLFGDPTRIKQILFNLVGNAIKFTDTGYVKVYLGWDNHRLLIRVRDSGIGITEDQRKRLFISYSQADPSTTRKYGGTGLGLVICKRLSELMGGVIDIDPSITQGACFWVELPLREETKEGTIQDIYQQAQSSVWVIEADHNNFGLTQALTTLNVKTKQFSSVSSMIEFANSKRTCPGQIWLDSSIFQNKESLTGSVEHSNSLISALEQIASLPWFNPEQLTLCSPLDQSYLYQSITKSHKHLSELLNYVLPLPFTPSSLVGLISNVHNDEVHPIEALTPQQKASLSSLSVMVVEDNSVNSLILCSFLNKLGISATLKANGQEALESFKENPSWDLILMDCEMPVMDGFEATQEIRQWEDSEANKTPTTPVKIVAISAHVREEKVEQALKSGMNDYLAKPITSQHLTSYLINHLISSQ
jgi:signal transduction histidine kinase/CheY-like chemotaxis protein